MIEVRLHGRGGQGAVTAAELVAQAAIAEGKYAQGFPSFGPERRGAPVTAFLRVSDTPIALRERVDTPDVVVVLDPTLLGIVDVTHGMRPGGTLIVNLPPDKLSELKDLNEKYNLTLVDASGIAMEALGVPITNTAIIGSLIKATGLCELDALNTPLENRFGKLAAKNIKAMGLAHQRCSQAEALNADAYDQPEDEGFVIEALHPFQEMEIGAEVPHPGNSREFLTGNWRTAGRPVINKDKCVKCGICWVVCPDMAFNENEEGFFDWDERYCKGCGICAEQCPAGAIVMEAE
ncbi:pyruvate ferredoxin oxidoreductase subunit gamma [Dethiosulfatarculus sandiegensis]|uniref:Pyruvate ferredoxin oxidoreductase subunit gamma n=2 Tax=Dethiosulfatarculus sandiegensis TaxID=1429043 RepID=A0A0D2K092_9BACT|nr:2-oxoacid:acceptor oxidoreductase family protein [Dethiosulfatarculus sandiegensis]KIX15160.1 pyruvate ferredoxin oxidoreductase subunit gamma [Dethiosulfatarculus sandiegensis]